MRIVSEDISQYAKLVKILLNASPFHSAGNALSSSECGCGCGCG